MKSDFLRSVLAILAGIIVGSAVNGLLIMLGGNLIPLPDGIKGTDSESLAKSIHLFEPKHFIFPFLAHALGTFVGAFTTAKIASRMKLNYAIWVGVYFLMGGVMMVFMLKNAPIWFSVVDLIFAYIPMAYLGGKLAIYNLK